MNFCNVYEGLVVVLKSLLLRCFAVRRGEDREGDQERWWKKPFISLAMCPVAQNVRNCAKQVQDHEELSKSSFFSAAYFTLLPLKCCTDRIRRSVLLQPIVCQLL